MIRLLFPLLLLFPLVSIANTSRYPIPFELIDEECMALNMYYEARAERSIYHIAAVGHVTLNRVKSKEWPNSICKVVYQQRLSKSRHWTPMFSWTKDNKSNIPINLTAYNKCLKIARMVILGEIKDNTNNSTHYHNTTVNPYWADSMILIAQLGNHIFYK